MFHLEKRGRGGSGEALVAKRSWRREESCSVLINLHWPTVEKARCLGSKEHNFVVDSVNTVSSNFRAQYETFHTEHLVLDL